MGVYGCMKFAHRNGLVRSQTSCPTKGTAIPVAVDLWNVMYGLMEKFYPKRTEGDDDAVSTLRCLFSLLRLLQKRAYFAIFVFDGGINGEVRAAVGAKAIVAETFVSPSGGPAGSGRIGVCGMSDPNDASGHGACEWDETWASLADSFDRECGCEGSNAPSDKGGVDKANAPPRRGRGNCSRWSSKPYTPRVVHKLCVSIIRHLGYAYVEAASSEADDICANLYHTKTVSYVVSSDTDLLLMGCDIVVDITPLFPSIIRCRDMLASLGVDYPTFLTKFVRCHTDLHKEPILKSMQEVIELIKRPSSVPSVSPPPSTPPSRSEEEKEKEAKDAEDDNNKAVRKVDDEGDVDEEGFVLVRAKWRKNKRSAKTAKLGPVAEDPRANTTARRRMCSGGTAEPAKFKREGGGRHAEQQTPPPSKSPAAAPASKGETDRSPTGEAGLALTQLPPAKTMCEVLERKFIKHVVGIMTPEKRTSRVSILKRVPITQEGRDEDAVCESIRWNVRDPWRAESLCRAACKKTPPIPHYGRVLSSYWD